MQLFIEPIDVWLFRDGKPFDARSDHRAQSIFPPYPSVMQGVIRSHQLVVQNIDLSNANAIADAVGTSTDFKKLNLRGPFLARWEGEQNARKLKRYFPVPADVAPQGDGYRTQKLKPRSRIKGVQMSLPDDELPALLFPPDDSRETEQNNSSKKELGSWMNEDELQKCLRGDKAITIETEDLFIRESRFGIGRNDATRTTEREYLYEVEFIRPCKNVGLYVEVNGYDGWASSDVMRIGGEGRGASYEKITAPALPSLAQKFPEGKLPAKFKVYFATPTYFKNGWLPESWGKFFEVEPTLVAAAVNRYESIGGFDWAKNDHKPARRYVPAGSVYYFEANGNVKLQDHVLETSAITDEGAQIGFGQVLIVET